MHACMHACVYACMYACMYVCMHVCANLGLYVRTHYCNYVCTYVCTWKCMYACVYVRMYVHTCVEHRHRHRQHTHTRTHRYTHTHKHTQQQQAGATLICTFPLKLGRKPLKGLWGRLVVLPESPGRLKRSAGWKRREAQAQQPAARAAASNAQNTPSRFGDGALGQGNALERGFLEVVLVWWYRVCCGGGPKPCKHKEQNKRKHVKQARHTIPAQQRMATSARATGGMARWRRRVDFASTTPGLAKAWEALKPNNALLNTTKSKKPT